MDTGISVRKQPLLHCPCDRPCKTIPLLPAGWLRLIDPAIYIGPTSGTQPSGRFQAYTTRVIGCPLILQVNCEQCNGQELATHINDFFSAICSCSSLPALNTASLPSETHVSAYHAYTYSTCQQPQAHLLSRDPGYGDSWPASRSIRYLDLTISPTSSWRSLPLSSASQSAVSTSTAHWGKVVPS